MSITQSTQRAPISKRSSSILKKMAAAIAAILIMSSATTGSIIPKANNNIEFVASAAVVPSSAIAKATFDRLPAYIERHAEKDYGSVYTAGCGLENGKLTIGNILNKLNGDVVTYAKLNYSQDKGFYFSKEEKYPLNTGGSAGFSKSVCIKPAAINNDGSAADKTTYSVNHIYEAERSGSILTVRSQYSDEEIKIDLAPYVCGKPGWCAPYSISTSATSALNYDRMGPLFTVDLLVMKMLIDHANTVELEYRGIKNSEEALMERINKVLSDTGNITTLSLARANVLDARGNLKDEDGIKSNLLTKEIVPIEGMNATKWTATRSLQDLHITRYNPEIDEDDNVVSPVKFTIETNGFSVSVFFDEKNNIVVKGESGATITIPYAEPVKYMTVQALYSGVEGAKLDTTSIILSYVFSQL